MYQMNDAATLTFAQNSLSNIEGRVYRRQYADYDYGRHMFVRTEGSPYAASTTFYVTDVTGEAKFGADSANDVPLVGMTRDQFVAPYYTVEAGFEYSFIEVEQSRLLGIPLDSDLPMGAKERVEMKLYQVAMIGASEKGWTGFVNDPAITSYTVAASGTGSSTNWANKTPAQILFDINTLLGGIPGTTANIEMANALRLPPSAWRYISSTQLGNGDGSMTILSFLRANNIYTAGTNQQLDIQPINELETAGAGGTGRMVAYRNEPEVVLFDLPMMFNLRPIVPYGPKMMRGMGLARTGGTQIRRPGAFRYADGITAAA